MQINWYQDLDHKVVFQVYDSGPTTYDVTNLLQSGFNLFVVRNYGNGNTPTFTQITNALGYTPVSPAQLIASNAIVLATATNLVTAERAALIATNVILLQQIIAVQGYASGVSNVLAAAHGRRTCTAMLATNNANLIITTNLVAAEHAAMLASNLVVLTTATNLTVQERAALNATNAILTAQIAAGYSGSTATNSFDPIGSATAVKTALIQTNNQTLTALNPAGILPEQRRRAGCKRNSALTPTPFSPAAAPAHLPR